MTADKIAGTIYQGTLDGTIDGFGRVGVKINTIGPKFARYYPGYFASGKNFSHFIGGIPQQGTAVTIAAGVGGEYFILSLFAPSKLPAIDNDSLLIQSDDKNKISLNPKTGIYLGNKSTKLRVHPIKGIISDNFDTKLHFSEASLSVDGIIKRDKDGSKNSDQREDIDTFESSLSTICFDPSAPEHADVSGQNKDKNSGATTRNYPLVEKREVVYEFAFSTEYSNDETESTAFSGKKQAVNTLNYDRRAARTDTLSLSLVSPNYLMETVKGTVVDVYGNILDLNRNILPVGKETDLSFKNKDRLDAFKKIRAIERKSIAYHFEINARKASRLANGVFIAPDITSSDNFARDRSRFSFDVDKEGQIKVNVPASSESGNVALLTRYENFSTINAVKNNTDPNELVFDGPAENKNIRRDIFLDSFAFLGGTVSIKDPANDSAYSPPVDRILNAPMRHGTAYHDITASLKAHRTPVTHQYEPVINDLEGVYESFPKYFVSREINISGSKANAGGRSGNINFDGSIEINVGANSVDKQSVWLDTQGSVLGSIGRDFNNVSMGLSMTGDLLIQVGGADIGFDDIQGPLVGTDPRFLGTNSAWRPGAIDIRVYGKTSECTIVRVDTDGVTVSTPGHINMVAGQSMTLKALQFINLEAEGIFFWKDDDSSVRELVRNNKSIL